MKPLPLALPDGPHRRRLLQALVLAAATSWVLGLPGRAQAAEPAPADKSAQESPRSYVVAPGDTLDRIVQKTMGASPLRIELLREALAAANPQAISSVRNPRLKAGMVLQLPDHEALLRQTIAPLLPADSAAHSQGGGDARKRWVRYP